MSPSRLRAIVFDLDDTLFREHDYVRSGFAAAARWLAEHSDVGATETERGLLRLFEEGRRGDLFDAWLEGHGLPGTHVSGMVDAYRSHVPEIQPFPGIEEVLDDLADRVVLGIVSDGYEEVQQAKLDALGLEPRFDAVVLSDSLGREGWKPSPRPFRLVLERLGVPAEAALYVGDNPLKDFLGARRAGMRTVWARHCDGDYSRHEPPSELHRPDTTVNTLDELTNTLMTALDGESL